MLAAENGALPGGKVGGLGDVLRDLPRALVRAGCDVTVVTPSYGFLARVPDTSERGTLRVPFAGMTETCRWLEVPTGSDGLRYLVLDHARFAPGGLEQIYHNDGSAAPFATDAGKFAFFCAAAAELLLTLPAQPDVLHLHDWHTAFLLLLRAFDARYRSLCRIRAVFTIHNLALQGIRPLEDPLSSPAQWYPGLKVPPEVSADPRYTDCINPLAVAIRLADVVTTVSPTYAREILAPADPVSGHHGGEGLEQLLQARHREGALVGILNGIEYPAHSQPRLSFARLLELVGQTLERWVADGSVVDSAIWLAERRLQDWPTTRPPLLAVSIGRVTGHKLALWRETLTDGSGALDRVLAELKKGLLIVLGNGDPDYERFLQQAMVSHGNLLYLKGYSDALAQALYASGDLFLMPSVFEPCGISQMLAMRAGQPCVAHATGGLRDTVTAANGFPFAGQSPREQAEAMVGQVAAAVRMKQHSPDKWQALVRSAKKSRFDWESSVQRYITKVYRFDADTDV